MRQGKIESGRNKLTLNDDFWKQSFATTICIHNKTTQGTELN